jgi:hypothetical protein
MVAHQLPPRWANTSADPGCKSTQVVSRRNASQHSRERDASTGPSGESLTVREQVDVVRGGPGQNVDQDVPRQVCDGFHCGLEARAAVVVSETTISYYYSFAGGSPAPAPHVLQSQIAPGNWDLPVLPRDFLS